MIPYQDQGLKNRLCFVEEKFLLWVDRLLQPLYI